MRRPVRKWLKNTLEQRRAFDQNPQSGKPPLLWLADLPRLAWMWIGHFRFRAWLPFRTFGGWLIAGIGAMFLAIAAVAKGAGRVILEPITALRSAWRGLQSWVSNGGIARGMACLANGLLEGIIALPGACLAAASWLFHSTMGALFGLFGYIGRGLAKAVAFAGTAIQAVASLAGLTAIAAAICAAFGLGSVGRGIAGLWGRLTLSLSAFWASLQSPQDVAWTFTAITGTVGLILLMIFQSSSIPRPARAGEVTEWQPIEPPPPVTRTAFVPEEQTKKPIISLPDPFRPIEEKKHAVDVTPFVPSVAPSVVAPVVAPTPQTPYLVAGFQRTALPPHIAAFGGAVFEKTFRVASQPARAIAADALPADDWLRTLSPSRVFDSVAPASYRTISRVAEPWGHDIEPRDEDDALVPDQRGVQVSIERTQPARTVAGRLLWYELIVTNEGSRRLPGLTVEEHVAAPHRIADAFPPARFSDRVLAWRLEGLESGESRRLRVGVYPESAAPIKTHATIRPVTTVSVTTKVQAPKPVVNYQPPRANVEPPKPQQPPSQPAPAWQERIADQERREDQPPDDNVYRQIQIAMTTPGKLVNGSLCHIKLVVTNTGTAPLSGVVVRSVLPPELCNEQGSQIETPVGKLAPGQSRTISLRVTGRNLGTSRLLAKVRAEEGVATSVRGSFEVVRKLETRD